jgi:putative flippase GtrA
VGAMAVGFARSSLARQLVRYGLSTGISVSVTVVLPILLHELFAVREERAVLIAFNTALVVNFLTLRHFVFSKGGSALRDLAFYGAINILFRVAEYGAFSLLFATLGLHYVIAILIVLFISAIVKFLVYRFVVFAPARAREVTP